MNASPEAAAFAVSTTLGVLLVALPWFQRTNVGVRRAFFWTFCALKALYFYWRVTETLPPLELSPTCAFSWAFLLLEVQVTVALYRWLKGLLSHTDRTAEANLHADWFLRTGEAPQVDILIPTYNEPWSVIEKTLVGATAQTYPNFRVFLLDDGKRPWLERAAAELGVHTLTRPDNSHAKAGNLNGGLAHVLGLPRPSDFVAVLDADFVARPSFLRRAMALMHDPQVGIVQTPQYHHNPDPFQRKFRATRGWPDTQRFAFSCFQPARDAEGGAYCCGTSFVARAEALRKIGGFPTESVTEDVLTTVKMNMSGYRTVYLGELLTTGLAAEGLHEYLTQRGRWCLGSVQLGLWLFDLDKEKRSLWNRLWGSEGTWRWGYTSLLRLVFLMVPVVYWLTGVPPFEANTSDVLVFAVPVMLLQRAFIAWMSRGTQLPLIYEASSLLANFVVVRALFKGLLQRRNHRFVVTDKGKSSDSLVIHWTTLGWFVGYAALLLFSLVYAHYAPDGSARSGGFQGVNLMWSVINLALVAIAAAPCFEEPRRRAEERYPTAERAGLRQLAGDGVSTEVELCDLSVSGCRLRTNAALRVGELVQVTLSGLEPFEARVARRAAAARKDRSVEWGLAFRLTDQERRKLTARIFCSADYVVPQEEGSVVLTARALLQTAFR